LTQIGGRTTGGLVKVSVSTGGSGYSSAPTVALSGGGGTGATAYAVMAGTMVDSVIVAAAGTGYTAAPSVSFSGGSGSGAAATATVYAGAMRYLTFFKGRYNDVYGVDGMGRGIRWNGDDASVEPIGIHKPCVGPSIAAASGTTSAVVGVQIVNGGAGYNSAPSVSFTGGGGSGATASASIVNGRVTTVSIVNPGSGYTAAPSLSFSGGIGTGASFGVGVVSGVQRIRVTAGGSGYAVTSAASTFVAPYVQFNNTNGLTGAHAEVVVSPQGKITDVVLKSAGTGGTTTGVTASVIATPGSGATLAVDQFFAVSSVTASSSGSGYMAAPVITVLPDKTDLSGSGAALTCTVNTTGQISAVTVLAGGTYSKPPTAVVLDTSAKATATLSPPLRGTYKCCFRYLDDTPESQGGPIPSSISELVSVDATSGSSRLTWTIPTTGADARATHVELWRTTANQSVILFRVATLAISGLSTYSDTLSDKDLSNSARDGYGLMPVTLPSGQINARRFQVPPDEFAVACMFQDRAWYGVDTTGQRPNALLFSEVDEPESVPEENELIIQENTAEPDRLVAMIPLGGMLLLAQTGHLYRLTYVAQPVIDASIVLAAYRGVLNSRCWDVIGGVAFMVDSNGMYAYDGQSEEAVSAPIDNYWRDNVIDFSKAEKFHVRADMGTRTVRFYYCKSSDTNPSRALCYCVATKAWWEETYPSAITATCRVLISGKQEAISGTSGGVLLKTSGTSDSGSAIPYEYRTGALPLSDERGSRTITFLYKPTAADSTLNLRLAYNNSSTPRENAVASDRGTGFVTTTGSTNATLNMKTTRSPLGDATGVARANFSGRIEPVSSGGDRHVAVITAGTATEQVVLHTIAVEGAG